MDSLFAKSVVVGNKPRKVRRELMKTMDKKERRAHLEVASQRNQGESRRACPTPHLEEEGNDDS